MALAYRIIRFFILSFFTCEEIGYCFRPLFIIFDRIFRLKWIEILYVYLLYQVISLIASLAF